MDQNSLRATFDKVALLYHKARPHYPDELFSTLIEISHLHKHSNLLEIGAGTGQATKPLAKMGYAITAIDIGAALIEVARRELHNYSNVQLINGTYEELTLPENSFDLVFAATSFHWIDPSIKFLKTHRLLKENGYLAIIHTNHVSDENGDSFFNASQPVYDRYGFTDTHQKPQLPKIEDLQPTAIDENLFKLIHFQLFPLTVTYTAREFVELLNTFSNHLAAPEQVRYSFYREIEAMINDLFQGKIEKHFSMSLTIAEKKLIS